MMLIEDRNQSELDEDNGLEEKAMREDERVEKRENYSVENRYQEEEERRDSIMINSSPQGR